MTKLSAQLSLTEREIKNAFTSFSWALTHRFFRQRTACESTKTKETHRKKLANLGVNNDLNPCNPDLTVFNYSKVPISYRLKTLLAFGLDFCLPIKSPDFIKYFYRFEYVYNNLSYSYNNECTNLSEFKSKLRSISMKYFYNFKSYKIFSCIAI